MNDLSSGQYSVSKNVKFQSPMLKSDLCDYSDVYIAVKGRMTVEDTNNAKKRNIKLIFKDNAPFRSCITKISNTFIDNAEVHDSAMPMYNL